MTEFIGRKCKRCGFYEKDSILNDDEFDEWELCPSDFSAPDGNYVHFKEKEFNATFLCPECLLFSNNGQCLATFSLKVAFTVLLISLYLFLPTTLLMPLQQLRLSKIKNKLIQNMLNDSHISAFRFNYF